MAYEIINIVALRNRAWEILPDNHVTIQSLLINFFDVFINYKEVGVETTLQMDLLDIDNVEQYRLNDTIYIDDYISDVDNELLLPADRLNPRDITKPKAVRYNDIYEFGLKVDNGTKFGYKQEDLVITPYGGYSPASKENKYLYLVADKIVFPTIVSPNAILPNATNILNETSSKNIGIIDFTELGGFEIEKVNANNCTIIKQSSISADVIFTSSKDLSNKTVFMVMHGMLLPLDKGYSVSINRGVSRVGFHLDYRKIVEQCRDWKYEKSWIYPIDGKDKGFDLTSIKPIEYLSTGDTALIIVGHNDVCILKEWFQRTNIDNHYIHYRAPTGVMYQCDGSVGQYKVMDYDFDFVAIGTNTPRGYKSVSSSIHPESLKSTIHKRLKSLQSERTAYINEYYIL